MSRRSRPQYRSGLGWILGVAFEDTLTRPVRLAQGFTCVRCCGTPRASSPHDLTAPALASHDGRDCVQLPPARGCYHLGPRRTFTSNPVPMPGTPSVGLRPHSGATAAARSHPGCRGALPQEDSIPQGGSILDAKGGRDWTRFDSQMFSTGLSSGDLDGRGTSVIFSDTSSLAVTCHPARSTNRTA